VTEAISAAEYRKLLAKGQHKYGARAVVADGYRFDSEAELERYQQLQLLLTGGQIADLVLQPSYELAPAFTDRNGRRWSAIRYKADFAYLETVTNVTVAEDVKGMITAVFRLKEKLFRARYPEIDFRIVMVG
jgi:hypothetical protein